MGMLLNWIPALFVTVIGALFCFRALKRGLGTLEKTRMRHYEDIRAREQQLLEDAKNIPRSERLRLAHAAVTDLLHLEGDRAGFSLSGQGSTLLLNTPDGVWRITLDMRERTLHHTHRALHSKECWLLSGFGREEKFADLAGLMRSLTAYLRGEKSAGTAAASLRPAQDRGRGRAFKT
ncbi:MAG: translation initiation factor IF-2 [Desulfovibrio sp.]|nr:translation initiation factor IF-2 [Desulfovibrio sp.]